MTDLDHVIRLVGRIAPLLHGKPSFVQGAALADLVAIWLAGHIVEGSAEQCMDAAFYHGQPENAKAIGTY